MDVDSSELDCIVEECGRHNICSEKCKCYDAEEDRCLLDSEPHCFKIGKIKDNKIKVSVKELKEHCRENNDFCAWCNFYDTDEEHCIFTFVEPWDLRN